MIIFGKHDENTLAQFHDVASRAVDAALMADGHMGYVMPIGGVAAYDNKVSVVGVGFDIACGNCAIKTNLGLSNISDRLPELAKNIFDELSFGVGLNNNSTDAPHDHALFGSDVWDIIPSKGGLRDSLRAIARNQLGTIGSGNHYVDVFVDEDGYIWVGVHFGSRGFGHKVASGFISLSQGGTWEDRGKEVEVLLDLDSQLGSDYWDMMTLAGDYAYAGREWVARKVVSMLGGVELDMVHNNHNFAWKENHNGRDLVVVRKGATPAFPNQRGFVGGSMGDNAVILRGTDCDPRDSLNPTEMDYEEFIEPVQIDALYSTVHGAGRIMSRTEAKGKIRKNGEVVKEPRILRADMEEWLTRVGVIRLGGDVDESPQAYRRLPDVLTDQGETVTILHTLKPLIVCMAPNDIKDPYKD